MQKKKKKRGLDYNYNRFRKLLRIKVLSVSKKLTIITNSEKKNSVSWKG